MTLKEKMQAIINRNGADKVTPSDEADQIAKDACDKTIDFLAELTTSDAAGAGAYLAVAAFIEAFAESSKILQQAMAQEQALFDVF